MSPDVLELILQHAGSAEFTVCGPSMLPSIWPGSVLQATRCGPGDVLANDLVVVASGSKIIIHRAVRCEGGQWITRGDLGARDDSLEPGPRILARVDSVVFGPWVWTPASRSVVRWWNKAVALGLPVLRPATRASLRLARAANAVAQLFGARPVPD